MQKSSRFLVPASVLLVLLMVVAAGTYTWYYAHNPCEVDAVRDASALLMSQLNTYDHAYQFAATASRTSVVRPLITLQQILMDTKQIPVPACMQTAKNEAIGYMAAVIDAFQAFAAQEPDATIRDLLDQSERHYHSFTGELEAVNKCAPFCLP